MKAKKALKRLNKVEALLSNVIDQFPASKQELGELLNSAKAAVSRAQETINSQLSTSAEKKTQPRGEIARRAGVTTDGRQSTPLAPVKRRPSAKRKSINALTRRRLKKTA